MASADEVLALLDGEAPQRSAQPERLTAPAQPPAEIGTGGFTAREALRGGQRSLNFLADALTRGALGATPFIPQGTLRPQAPQAELVPNRESANPLESVLGIAARGVGRTGLPVRLHDVRERRGLLRAPRLRARRARRRAEGQVGVLPAGPAGSRALSSIRRRSLDTPPDRSVCARVPVGALQGWPVGFLPEVRVRPEGLARSGL